MKNIQVDIFHVMKVNGDLVTACEKMLKKL